MKHFITFGRPNRDGTGPAKILAGPDVPHNDQRTAILQMKISHEYPEGIEFAQMCELLPIHTAVDVRQTNKSEPTKPTKKK